MRAAAAALSTGAFLSPLSCRQLAHHGVEQVADPAAAHLGLVAQHHLRLQLQRQNVDIRLVLFPLSPNPLLLLPDLGLFLFDVASDIFNGIIFVKDYNLASGWAVIGIIFLPMSVVYAFAALFSLINSSSWCKTMLLLLLGLILAPLVVPTMTVAYIAFVASVFARKCLEPGYTPDDFNNGHSAGFLKLLEALFGASFQAVLGLSP